MDEESSKLTTFLVESGRYRYTRAPIGLNPSSDHFCLRSDRAFATVADLLKIVDDGLLKAPTLRDLLSTFRQVLKFCSSENLMLSRPKLQIGQSVVFAVYEISLDGVRPEPKKTDAILKFPVPSNISELRSFLRLVNQLGIFVPDLVHMTQELLALLKKNVAFLWLKEHHVAFEKVKQILLAALLIRPFNPTLETCLLYTSPSPRDRG